MKKFCRARDSPGSGPGPGSKAPRPPLNLQGMQEIKKFSKKY